MGYVPPRSQLDRIKAARTPEERREAVADILHGYNRYRAGMRSGLFGLVFGRWLFPASGDMPIPREAGDADPARK